MQHYGIDQVKEEELERYILSVREKGELEALVVVFGTRAIRPLGKEIRFLRDKLKDVRDEIITETGNDAVHGLVCDLASMKDVRELASTIKEQFPILDVLINNAGSFQSKQVLTEDGFEMQFAVNHLSHFLLTNLLLPELKAAPQWE